MFADCSKYQREFRRYDCIFLSLLNAAAAVSVLWYFRYWVLRLTGESQRSPRIRRRRRRAHLCILSELAAQSRIL
jgi:hypothetical protein